MPAVSPDDPETTDGDGRGPAATRSVIPGSVKLDTNEPSERPGPSLTFPVVGIGASAGGLEALEALTHRLRPDRIAFVVMQHLAPSHVSMLGEILKRGTSLRVVTVETRMRLEPGVLYVASPNFEVALQGEELQVSAIGDGHPPRHTIDAFLRTLAKSGGPMAIGVILSGSGSDGTLGLKAIKEEGGITFVQEPSTAAQPSMPQSALDAGCADFSLTPAEIGDELMRVLAHPYVARARAAAIPSTETSAKIFGQLRSAFGVDFAQYKPSTVERRIGRRMALHKLDKVDDYVQLLATQSAELRSLYDDLLIGVTGFFRDNEPFEALKTVVFPRLIGDRPTEVPIRVWVAGCSTGEEAFSVAMALFEFLGDRASKYVIQIFATDIDEGALSRARTAAYPPNIELDVSAERLRRFFARTDKGYQVKRLVRDVVVFARHNLGKDPPFSRVDLVTCRNVLIYMQPGLQKRVVRVFHYALNADAYLLLGTSESVGDTADLFSLLDRKLKIYAKKNIAAGAMFDVNLPAHADDPEARRFERRPIVNVAQVADKKVIEKYGPPGVIVDERLDILQFRGRTGAFLEPAPGAATLNLLKLARPELLVALRTVTHKALSEGLPSTSAPVPLWSDHAERLVSFDILPLPDVDARKCLLVLFREVVSPPRPSTPAEEGAESTHPRVLELERELAANKEYLQGTIEELETANEELQSSNEELQSANEEMQSTNEALETSKEELQSTNEELATVNDELHNRMTQLSIVNEDLQNVMTATGAIVMIIGHDLRIRRFSTAAERLLSLIPGDAGRPITYLRNVMSSRDIEQLASDAMAQVSTREQRVRCIDGAWYAMKMVPYLTADHAIRGLILELTRTESPAAAAAGDDPVPPFTQQLLTALPYPVMLLDKQLRLAWANRTFLERFGIGPGALGRPLAEAWGSATDPTELWGFLDELMSGRTPRDMMIERPFGRTADHPMRFVGRLVAPDSGAGPGAGFAVVTMQDVTPR